MNAPGVLAGTTVAGFLLESLVGRGGMGEVYRSHDATLDRAVAVKVVAAEDAGDGTFAQRAVDESLRAASIEHPNVIPVYAAGRDGDRVFIAMRYVAGGDLRALLRREGRLGPARALALLAQVASALDAAHARGLVHRDVKPSNILIDDQDDREHPYLADFGLTVGPDDGVARLGSGVSLGTIGYVSPEGIRGDPVSGRADQYALACMLFECLTGTPPFRGDSELGVLFAHLEEPPPRVTDRRVELPAALDDAIARGLAKAAGDRFETCQALVAATAHAFATAPRRRSRRIALAAAAAALAAAGVLATALLLGGGSGAAGASGTIRRIDPGSGHVVATFPVSPHPGQIAVGDHQLWTVDLREGALWRLDTARGDLVRIPSVGNPRDVAILGGSAYVADDSFATYSGNVTRYDAATGQREGGLALLACAIAAGEGVVWAAGCPDVQRLSTGDTALRIVAKGAIPLPTRRSAGHDRTLLQDVAVGERAVWALGDATDPRVWKIDRTSGRILATTRLPFAPRSLAAGAGGVWVTGGIADVVARLDPESGRILAIVHLGRGASGVTTGGDRVWVVSALAGELAEIDPRTAHVVRTLQIGGLPREVAYADHTLWVTGDAR